MKSTIRFWLLVLSSVAFLNPFGILTATQAKFIFYFVSIVVLILTIKRKSSCDIPHRPYLFLMGGIAFSIVMVALFQNQSISLTIVSTLSFFIGFLGLFLFDRLDVPIDRIKNYIKFLSIIGMLAYVINMLNFPNLIFNSGNNREDFDLSRGIVRIGVPLLDYIIMLYFYMLGLWQKTNKKSAFMWILLCYVFILLTLTRQVIFLTFVLGFLMLFSKTTLLKKITIIIFASLIIFVILPKIPIIQSLIEISEEQSYNNKYKTEDIRITAWKYYTNDNQTNGLTRIFGNGVPSEWNSPWGIKFAKEIYAPWGGNGCYTVDVGWAGFYFYFGIFATIGLFGLLFKGIKRNINGQNKFISYYLIYIAISSVASAPILFYNQITALCLALYIAYKNHNPVKECLDGRNNYIKLQ